MTPDTTEDAQFLAKARQRFQDGLDADRINREEALEDLRFLAGEQWPESVAAERTADMRPMLTIDRLTGALRQVVGDIRMNPPGIKIRAVDDVADPKLADVQTGLTRNIEHCSSAKIAYVQAGMNSAACGMGDFRVSLRHNDDDTFDTDIVIEQIPNPFAVIYDPSAKDPTKSDAKWFFVTDRISRDEFTQRWPDANEVDFDAPDTDTTLLDWYQDETIRIAEYWYRVPVTREIARVRKADGTIAVVRSDAIEPEDEVLQRRKVETHRLECVLMSGAAILERAESYPGKLNPVIRVTGEEIHVGERTVRRGMIRTAKDSQRVYNFAVSAFVETVALQPKAPFIATVKQVEGLETLWSQANKKNLPYLPYHPDGQAPPPQRQAPPQPSAGWLQTMQVAADDVKITTGIFDASLGQRSNETSGKAILARQREGDVSNFVFSDNLAHAVAQCGRVILDLIPHVYTGERIVRTLGEDGAPDYHPINQQRFDLAKLAWITTNDITVGKYDVAVDTGPSFTTKRVEAAESMMAYVQAVPQAGIVMGDLLAKAQDWPHAEEIGKRLRRMMPPGMVEPDPDDPPMPQQPPDPTVVAKVEQAQAQTAKTMAETEGVALDNATKVVQLETMMGQMDAMVAAAVQNGLQSAIPQIMAALGAQLGGGAPPTAPPDAANQNQPMPQEMAG